MGNGRLQDIYGTVPHSLRDADDMLHRYGRWCKDRLRLHRCGSAERAYRAPQDDLDREPRPVILHIDLVTACRRALAKVPEKERVILAILYVPKRIPAHVQLRLMRIPPRLSQERHILGLRMFDNRMKTVYSAPPDTTSARRHATRQAESSEVVIGASAS